MWCSRCESCGESIYSPERWTPRKGPHRTKFAVRTTCRASGRQVDREQYSLSQTQLEQLLGHRTETVVRWERGTVFQNRSTDMLLRIIRDIRKLTST